MTKQMYIAILFSMALALGVSTLAVAQSKGQQDSAQQKSSQQQQQQQQQQSQTKKSPTATTTADASSGILLNKQQPSETLMSNLVGITVKNGSGEKAETIGTINDIVLNKDHKVVGVLVGVGGFLGIAETNYGMAWDALQINADKSIAVVDVTRKQLDEAASYMTLAEQKAKREQQRSKQQMRQQQQQMAPSLDQNTAPGGG